MSCVLNIANDGSEDEIIHCFNPKKPCHAGRQQLKSQLSVLDERSRDNLFENITDSDVEDAVDDLMYLTLLMLKMTLTSRIFTVVLFS